MNRKSLIAFIVVLTMLTVPFFSSCSKKPETIEEYLANQPESMEDLKQNAEKSGLELSISGNDITYSYDISSYEDMTEELAKSDKIVEALGDALEDSEDNFSDLCSKLEEESNIEGIRIIVKYSYGDEELVSKSFTASGAEDSDSSKKDKSEDSDSEESGDSEDSSESDSSEE
jgi:molybdopterin converting factor small subunit